MKIRNLLCGIGLISTSVFASDPIHTDDGWLYGLNVNADTVVWFEAKIKADKFNWSKSQIEAEMRHQFRKEFPYLKYVTERPSTENYKNLTQEQVNKRVVVGCQLFAMRTENKDGTQLNEGASNVSCTAYSLRKIEISFEQQTFFTSVVAENYWSESSLRDHDVKPAPQSKFMFYGPPDYIGPQAIRSVIHNLAIEMTKIGYPK